MAAIAPTRTGTGPRMIATPMIGLALDSGGARLRTFFAKAPA